MAEEITRDICFLSQKENKSSPARMHLRTYTKQDRQMRAAKALLTFWIIAAVCVLIPIAHFILVPGFFVGGIIVALRVLKTSEEGMTAIGTCPVCSKDIDINLEKQAELPQWHPCPQCADRLELQAAADTT